MRKVALWSLVVLGFGVVALGWTFVPVRLTPAALSLPELPSAAPPAEMSISALPTAELGARAAFAYRGGSFAEPRSFAQAGLLIRHPKGDLLIDTGLGSQARAQFAEQSWLMRTFSALTLRSAAAKQLREAGYDTTQLAGIVPTHVHWDHISGVPDFPGVSVWLNDVERAFIAEGGHASALMRSFEGVKTRRYAFVDQPYLGFARSFDVWGDGSIVLVPAPGHTPGSIIAFVTLPSNKRVALLGDLVWQTDGIRLPAERPWLSRRQVDVDSAQVRSAIEHVAGLSARFPELMLLPAHDARAWAAVPVFPERMR
jgi:glyoxylase-like metal-dependent hydrolase (beta-lactamase superfamily II)